MNEHQRIQQVLSGHASAFAYFVETYQDMAITIAYRICDNMQDAEDIVQDSYIKAYKHLHAFRLESKSLHGSKVKLFSITLLVTFIFSLLWLIATLDTYLRKNKKMFQEK